MATLTITDETPAGAPTGQVTLELPAETLTVRELLRARIYQEVDDHNRRLRTGDPLTFTGLVTPTRDERTLNGPPKPAAEVDWQEQSAAACRAFESNGFFILVNDHQPDTLDTPVTLHGHDVVSFVKLTPLVGG